MEDALRISSAGAVVVQISDNIGRINALGEIGKKNCKLQSVDGI